MPDTRRAILTWHSIDESGSVISVRPARFLRQIQALVRSRATVAPLADLLQTPPPAVALTFDDGYRNFADLAAPVLARHRLPATVFLVSERCGGYNDWRQPKGIPRLPLMDWTRLREIQRAGFDFGAHSATHPDLSELDEAAARQEILASKQRLEQELGRPVLSFAYPYGSMTGAARRAVAENFRLGCSTRLGWVTPASAPEALERLDVYYLSASCLVRGLFGPLARGYVALRAALRELR